MIPAPRFTAAVDLRIDRMEALCWIVPKGAVKPEGAKGGERHPDRNGSGRFKYAIVLTTLTRVAGVIGGIRTRSPALLSDGTHVFLDMFALILSRRAAKHDHNGCGRYHHGHSH